MRSKDYTHPLLAICIASILLVFVGCSSNGNVKYRRFAGKALGTYYSITVASSMADSVVQQTIDSTFSAVNYLFSIYDSSTVISHFNRAKEYVVNTEFAALLSLSQRMSELTQGAYDPTVGVLARLWGFGADQFKAVDTAALAAARTYTGYKHIRISGDTVFKDDPRVELTLNAMAKGYASDRIAAALQQHGCTAAMVEVGGEIATYGSSPRGDAWRLGIDAPEKGNMPGEKLITTFTLDSGGIATSGNYREFQESNGKEWGHTINPTTGMPERNNLLSATVVAGTCAIADALATAMMVLGPEKSMALVEETDGIECVLLYLDNGELRQWASAGIKGTENQ